MSMTRTPRDRTNAHDMGPDPYAETVAREFAGSFSEPGIEIVLDGCIEDLSGVSSASAVNAAQPPNPSPSSAKADHDRHRDETEIPFQINTIRRYQCLWDPLPGACSIRPDHRHHRALSSRLLAGAGSPESTVVQ